MFVVRIGRLSFDQVEFASAVGGCHGVGGSAPMAVILELESSLFIIFTIYILLSVYSQILAGMSF